MELKYKSSADGIETDYQNRDKAFGIGVGLLELTEVCWS
jgi:hypothetical protein